MRTDPLAFLLRFRIVIWTAAATCCGLMSVRINVVRPFAGQQFNYPQKICKSPNAGALSVYLKTFQAGREGGEGEVNRGSGDWVLFLRWFENCTRDIFHGILISFFNFHEEEETRKLCSHVATCCQGVPAAAQYRAQQRDVARSSISVSQLTFYVTSDTNFTTFAMCFMLLLHVAPLPVVGCPTLPRCSKRKRFLLWTTIRAEQYIHSCSAESKLW